MKLKEQDKEWIEKSLSYFDFVLWDRLTPIYTNPFSGVTKQISVFGWIFRDKDYYKDFVVLEYDVTRKKVKLIATSSEKYSKYITLCLNLYHTDCIRVQEVFSNENVIRIGNLK